MHSTLANPLQKTARLAGFFYLLVALIAPFAIMYVPSKIIVWGDASMTVNNILANEFLFRSGIAVRMLVQVLMLITVWYLYRLLKDVHIDWAKLMMWLYLVAVPVGFLVNAFNVTALVLAKGKIMQSFSVEQLNDLTELFLRIGSYDTQLVQLFWGLWLLPFSLLIHRSGFIPRIFAWLIFANGVTYVVLCLTFVLFPGARTIVHKLTLPFLFLGEIPIIFWLLIKGVKRHQ